MSTVIRAELSSKNRYWIDRHRYYELKHFCLQYPSWKKLYRSLNGCSSVTFKETLGKTNKLQDPVGESVIKRQLYFDHMKLVEQASIGADPELSQYILKAVTEGLSYENLKLRLDIPCCRDTYYDRYRRFFWLLDRSRR